MAVIAGPPGDKPAEPRPPPRGAESWGPVSRGRPLGCGGSSFTRGHRPPPPPGLASVLPPRPPAQSQEEPGEEVRRPLKCRGILGIHEQSLEFAVRVINVQVVSKIQNLQKMCTNSTNVQVNLSCVYTTNLFWYLVLTTNYLNCIISLKTFTVFWVNWNSSSIVQLE